MAKKKAVAGGNATMNKARNAKADEFYTQLSDIEKETKYYKQHFKGKTVLCNCDDPYASQFFVHFFRKFSAYGLKKLISVCYKNCQPDLFSENKDEHSIWLEYTGGADESRDPTKEEISQWVRPLNGDGDFRKPECIDLLKQADIVCTNPPFSLLDEFIQLLVKYDKKFLIIGQHNVIHYAKVFKLFKENKVWLGYKYGDMAFRVPDYYEPRKTRYWVDDQGQKWRSHGNICWFTNLDIKKRHEDITLYKNYDPVLYPKYDNYDAINVTKVAEIPCDYDGLMGVPITFMGKHNPDQFELVGVFNHGCDSEYDLAKPILDGKELFTRVAIRRIKKG